MAKQRILGFGLRPTPEDERDFALGNVVRLPDPKTLPSNFVLEPLSTKDQKDSDFCTAFATCYMSEIQEGTELAPEWTFAVSKVLSNNPENWGQDIRYALKAHVKYGALRKTDSPFTLESSPESTLRYIENWPEDLFQKAVSFRKRSFFKISGQHDHFDNIRGTIYYFRKSKRAAGLGVNWSWPLDNPIIREKNNGIGHMVTAIGWKEINQEPYLIIHNSYGRDVGENGNFYFSRSVINYFVDLYGAYCFVDLAPEEAKLLNKYKLSTKWRWLANFLSLFYA